VLTPRIDSLNAVYMDSGSGNNFTKVVIYLIYIFPTSFEEDYYHIFLAIFYIKLLFHILE